MQLTTVFSFPFYSNYFKPKHLNFSPEALAFLHLPLTSPLTSTTLVITDPFGLKFTLPARFSILQRTCGSSLSFPQPSAPHLRTETCYNHSHLQMCLNPKFLYLGFIYLGMSAFDNHIYSLPLCTICCHLALPSPLSLQSSFLLPVVLNLLLWAAYQCSLPSQSNSPSFSDFSLLFCFLHSAASAHSKHGHTRTSSLNSSSAVQCFLRFLTCCDLQDCVCTQISGNFRSFSYTWHYEELAGTSHR